MTEGVESLVRDALQEMMNCWNSIFAKAEEMVIDLCFYVSPFPSTMVTARQLHAAALPLKSFFLCSTPWTSLTLFALAYAR